MENEKIYNEIDMECDISALDDEDISFGNIVDRVTPKSSMRTISADMSPEGILNIQKNFKSIAEEDYSGYNQIDMECDAFDDTEDYLDKKTGFDVDLNNSDDFEIFQSEEHIKADKLDFGDLDEEIEEKSILHKMKNLKAADLNLDEASKKIPGEVTKDYWALLSKKHRKTDKKGAMSPFVKFPAGDPERNMELFNQEVASSRPSPSPKIADNLTNIGDIGTITADAGSTGDSAASGSDGGGMGEAAKDNKLSAKLKKLIESIQFRVTFKENSYLTEDLFNYNEPKTFNSLNEVLQYLKPYIMDELSMDNNQVEDYLKSL